MKTYRYRGGLEFVWKRFHCGMVLGWSEMVFGLAVDTTPGMVCWSFGIGPLWVWINTGG